MPPYPEPQADSSPLRLHHHYFYIIIWALLASIILYIPGGLSFVDALLLASGAATQTGLNPIDLKDLHISQQITLWLVPMVTNVVFLHSLLVLIRIYWFRKRFKSAIREAKAVCHRQRQRMNQALDYEARRPIGLNRTITDTTDTTTTAFDSSDRDDEEQPLLGSTDDEISPGASPPTPVQGSSPVGYQTFKPAAIGPSSPRITFYESDRDYEARQKRRSSFSRRRSFSEAVNEAFPRTDSSNMPALPSLMWQHSIASYSDWDEDQKEELGGIEYRALKTLMVILVCYFLAFHLLGIILFIPWIMTDSHYSEMVKDMGLNRPWWAVFTAGSAFHDLGYTLSPDSMSSFRNAAFPLLVMTFLVVIGNTGFPCMLRLIIWLLTKFTRYGSPLDDELHYLLEHPRRCFTMLFPGSETWRLAGVLLLLNALDLFVFYTLQENPQSNNPFSPGLRLVDGLFQIASTRTAGFSITSLGALHPAVQVSFVVMMYISAFPIAIAIRKTNVYEEKSLGIYDDEDKPNPHGLAAHIQRQLGFDLWYVMLGFFLISVTEGKRIQQTHGHDLAFSLFPLLFEIVSAYGTVGLSLGYPKTETSLSAQFNPVSKLIIIAMQVRGRHRGLPHALDHAILLPCDVHQDQQGEWWWKRWLKRKSSNISNFFSHGNASEDLERLSL
ncbi:cation transport protein-domain-containing protein [Aspergillus pseudotamarii]|uniref:Cation transport protein-domain-containing protein n=1 Tax=Aspergillus pseudotamarii TaxID=132259 RepID=A0A5N6SU73_ASPPS|nr:cation transport protein-domain-containing protein [Aspergillus pseudotamarii]KAE8138175.1 cation transport protein-domain-containing protein [Aspergillus pseudotamarii]